MIPDKSCSNLYYLLKLIELPTNYLPTYLFQLIHYFYDRLIKHNYKKKPIVIFKF